MSTGTWEVVDLVAALLFAVASFYYFVAGVHFEDRALSRLAGLAFLIFAGAAVVFAVRILL